MNKDQSWCRVFGPRWMEDSCGESSALRFDLDRFHHSLRVFALQDRVEGPSVMVCSQRDPSLVDGAQHLFHRIRRYSKADLATFLRDPSVAREAVPDSE